MSENNPPRGALFSHIYIYKSLRYAQKNGEVVGPAGGETGGPHCLAEVYKLQKAAILYIAMPKCKIRN